jgi:two-component system sensor histidine kinase KdpD
MNEDLRPDPDALVERIRQDEQKAAHGRLRIYFGASAGVGKTYAMLVGARALKATGIDVVAGVIETRADRPAANGGARGSAAARGHGRRRAAVAEFDLTPRWSAGPP